MATNRVANPISNKMTHKEVCKLAMETVHLRDICFLFLYITFILPLYCCLWIMRPFEWVLQQALCVLISVKRFLTHLPLVHLSSFHFRPTYNIVPRLYDSTCTMCLDAKRLLCRRRFENKSPDEPLFTIGSTIKQLISDFKEQASSVKAMDDFWFTDFDDPSNPCQINFVMRFRCLSLRQLKSKFQNGLLEVEPKMRSTIQSVMGRRFWVDCGLSVNQIMETHLTEIYIDFTIQSPKQVLSELISYTLPRDQPLWRVVLLKHAPDYYRRSKIDSKNRCSGDDKKGIDSATTNPDLIGFDNILNLRVDPYDTTRKGWDVNFGDSLTDLPEEFLTCQTLMFWQLHHCIADGAGIMHAIQKLLCNDEPEVTGDLNKPYKSESFDGISKCENIAPVYKTFSSTISQLKQHRPCDMGKPESSLGNVSTNISKGSLTVSGIDSTCITTASNQSEIESISELGQIDSISELGQITEIDSMSELGQITEIDSMSELGQITELVQITEFASPASSTYTCLSEYLIDEGCNNSNQPCSGFQQNDSFANYREDITTNSQISSTSSDVLKCYTSNTIDVPKCYTRDSREVDDATALIGAKTSDLTNIPPVTMANDAGRSGACKPSYGHLLCEQEDVNDSTPQPCISRKDCLSSDGQNNDHGSNHESVRRSNKLCRVTSTSDVSPLIHLLGVFWLFCDVIPFLFSWLISCHAKRLPNWQKEDQSNLLVGVEKVLDTNTKYTSLMNTIQYLSMYTRNSTAYNILINLYSKAVNVTSVLVSNIRSSKSSNQSTTKSKLYAGKRIVALPVSFKISFLKDCQQQITIASRSRLKPTINDLFCYAIAEVNRKAYHRASLGMSPFAPLNDTSLASDNYILPNRVSSNASIKNFNEYPFGMAASCRVSMPPTMENDFAILFVKLPLTSDNELRGSYSISPSTANLRLEKRKMVLTRLLGVKTALDEIKRKMQVYLMPFIITFQMELFFPYISKLLTRIFSSKLHAVVSNLVGPKEINTIYGLAPLECAMWPPTGSTVGMVIALLSVGDKMLITTMMDEALATDYTCNNCRIGITTDSNLTCKSDIASAVTGNCFKSAEISQHSLSEPQYCRDVKSLPGLCQHQIPMRISLGILAELQDMYYATKSDTNCLPDND